MNRDDDSRVRSRSPAGFTRPGLIAITLGIGLGVASLAFIATSHAATRTTTFEVTAQIVSDCSIVNAPNLDFGIIGVQNIAYSSTATLSVVCTPGTSYSVSLDAGSVAGSTVTTRYLAGPDGNISYSLYRDSGYTQVWGNTVGTNTAGGTGTGSNQNYTIYGRITAMQTTKAPGSYSSTVTATITY